MTMLAPLEVGICCADLDTLAAFYTGVLGFTAVGTIEVPAEKAVGTGLCDAGYRVTRLQTPYGERIKLLQPATPPAESAPAARILDRRNTVYLTFIIDDLHGMVDRLRGAGVEPLTGPEPVEVRPGTVLAFVRDPEGNVLEFVQYADVRAYRPDL
ncbi:VOC family protein [Azospirillum sp.]|uniref:VOC family protein n=1 Tax=Azospirillum sp. TaxID=34012 RepID=UPI002D34E015|nr:VOC family protein [Azospirillum sp.]HYD70290.1 VOC family protein [Azospirillum sp.]